MTNDDIIKLCSLREKNVSCEDVDPVQLAKHGVVGWVLFLHPELKTDAFMRQVFSIVVQNQKNIKVCDKLLSTMGESSIEVALLKGAALMTSFYKETYLRPIGDIDIWVKHEDAIRAHQILKSLSTTYKEEYKTYVLHQSIKTHLPEVGVDGQIVELHYNLYSQDSDKNPTDPVSDHLNRDGKYIVLDDEMMLYHLTTHIIKNRSTIGLRMGWIVDIVMLFEKWGCETPSICRKTMSLNSSMAKDMIEIWQYVVSLVPKSLSEVICSSLEINEMVMDGQFLEAQNKGYKHGLSARFRSLRCFLSASIGYVSQKRGIREKVLAMSDIAHDLRIREYYN